MFGLGMMEIGLIAVVAVILFPAKELPKLARTIARIYGQVRKTAEDFRSTVLQDEDLREPIDEIKGAYNDARWEVRDAERKARKELAKAQMEMRLATARRLQSEREAAAKKKAEVEAGGEGSEESSAVAAVSATAGGGESAEAKPMKIAAVEPEQSVDSVSVDAHSSASAKGPVAGSDPRVIAGRRAGTYTPRAATSEGSAEQDPWKPASGSGTDDGPREGVA